MGLGQSRFRMEKQKKDEFLFEIEPNNNHKTLGAYDNFLLPEFRMLQYFECSMFDVRCSIINIYFWYSVSLAYHSFGLITSRI